MCLPAPHTRCACFILARSPAPRACRLLLPLTARSLATGPCAFSPLPSTGQDPGPNPTSQLPCPSTPLSIHSGLARAAHLSQPVAPLIPHGDPAGPELGPGGGARAGGGGPAGSGRACTQEVPHLASCSAFAALKRLLILFEPEYLRFHFAPGGGVAVTPNRTQLTLLPSLGSTCPGHSQVGCFESGGPGAGGDPTDQIPSVGWTPTPGARQELAITSCSC